MDSSESSGQFLSPDHPQTTPTTLQDAKRLGFARSFHRLSQLPMVERFQQQVLVNDKMKAVFVDMCAVVERGVNDALMHKFHVAHGITPPSYGLGSTMNLSGGASNPTLAKTKSNVALNNSNSFERSDSIANATGIPTIGIDGDFGDKAGDDGNQSLSKHSRLAQSGSMASLNHSRSVSRKRVNDIGLKHTRSLHRAGSGRVRSAGKCAACYLSKEESYKLRLTVEARVQCPPIVNAKSLLTADASSNHLDTSGFAGGESESQLLSFQQETGQARSCTQLNMQEDSQGRTTTACVTEQAREIRNAIFAIVTDMPIPGTPIIIAFNAIVSYGGGMPTEEFATANAADDSNGEYALAFSWKSETSTPSGEMIMGLRQQRMESAYREQGVELDSVKAERAARQRSQTSLISRFKGLLGISGGGSGDGSTRPLTSSARNKSASALLASSRAAGLEQ
ncbi:hypothetical protein HDU82_002149 [Entophlyctis luteolus]|nr:hypothetical protein HDU82_002149 [Entophlyctis luteolus]